MHSPAGTAATQRVPLRPAASRALSMPRSAIREIMALAAGQPDIIHLEVGEPDFTTPDFIIEKAFAKVRAGATRYTPNAGTTSLRASIARHVTANSGQEIAAEQIVVTTGAIGALFSAAFAVLDPGDEILIPDPGWPNYQSIAHLAGATATTYNQPAARGFLPDAGEIEALISPRTKAILINSPGNPTGAVFPQQLMAAIAGLADRYGLYLISDEVYEDFVFEGIHVSALDAGSPDRTIIVSGVSKSYAMTGWRVGYLIAAPEIAKLAAALQEPVTSCPPAPSQAAAEAALAGGRADVVRFRDAYRRRRDILVEVFTGHDAVPVVPQGAFYGFLDIAQCGEKSLPFARRLLQEQRVAAVPGITFGPASDGFIRVAFTIEDAHLRDGLQRIRRALAAGASS